MTQANQRTADSEIEELFLARWSPRAFTTQEIGRDELFRLFEAARWAPSAYNAQPWRFVYALRGDAHWDRLLGLLNPFNASWVKEAAALVVVASKLTLRPPGRDEDVPNYNHAFDAGAAWALLALQATRIGFQAHGMAGFDHARATTELNLPEGYRPEAMIAIGRPGDPSSLPEGLRAREVPSQRDPIAERVFEGLFPA